MLYETPTVILVALLLLGMVATVEVGLRIGQRYGERTWSNAMDIHTTLSGATLALLGLMLAFTFDMSATRYDARRSLIVTQASVIEAVRSNLDFLAPQPRAQAMKLLHFYTGKQIAFLAVGHDSARENRAVAQAHALHDELWRIATNETNYTSSDPELRGTQYQELTEALIELNQVARQREAARERRVPEAVLLLLFALAVGSGGVLAYMSGASGHPDRLPTYAVMLMVCLVIYIIIDFDRPRRGLMHLDPAPLQQQLAG